MRKICKYCLTLVAILASTNVWGIDINMNVPFYAKVSVKVSSKAPDGGMVYVFSRAWVDTTDWWTKPNPKDLYDWNDIPTEQEIMAGLKSEYVDYPVYALYPLLSIGSTQLDTAFIGAFPSPGYYFKGWSKVDNDYDLGAEMPFMPSILTMVIH